jgi:hypothetical protein
MSTPVQINKFCRHYPDANLFEYNFDSFADVMAVANHEVSEIPRKWGDSSRSPERDGSFYGTKNFEEAMALARGGWAEGRQKVVHTLEKMYLPVAERLRAFDYDVTGAVPFVPGYIAGEPIHMMNPQDVSVVDRNRIITFTVGVSYPCGTSTDLVANYGAVILALTDILENLGFRIEIVVTENKRAKGKNYLTKTMVKSSVEQPDLDRLAFTLMHASFKRRLLFSVMETIPQVEDNGYGMCFTAQQFYNQSNMAQYRPEGVIFELFRNEEEFSFDISDSKKFTAVLVKYIKQYFEGSNQEFCEKLIEQIAA